MKRSRFDIDAFVAALLLCLAGLVVLMIWRYNQPGG